MTLIDEAVAAGARCFKACHVLGIHLRTLRRWRQADSLVDKRQEPGPRECPNALTDAEKEQIVSVALSTEYKSLPPSQIVPALADKGIYIASESTFYRVLREADLVHRRGRANTHPKRNAPDSFCATGPNQLWSWDITYLPSSVRGQFYYLYLIVDLYSRFIVGWEVHDCESSQHAATLISQACFKQGIN